jgi:DNA-3-methyladenine glycosylase
MELTPLNTSLLKASKFKEYEKYDTINLAKILLGKILVCSHNEVVTAGIITETEAYLHDDPACHAHLNKKTPRNEAMFMKAGTGYVYFIYGMYYCFNVVSNIEGIGEAVLIRSLLPIQGVEIMQQRRNMQNVKQLCNGPGKLCQALGIDASMNTISLLDDILYIIDYKQFNDNEIISTSRIGISKGKELPYRFYVKEI